jgi:hypothetical protein
MKNRFAAEAILVLFSATLCLGTSTRISYTSIDVGSGRWQYTYDVTNIGLTENIEEFIIWFDYGLYDNLAIDTLSPFSDNWDEIVIQPEPAISDDGFYDALALGIGIGQDQTISGFSVSFDWLGTGTPGLQFYEIVNPVTFESIDSGFTVPEPITLILFTFGLFGIKMNTPQRLRGYL